MDQKVKCKRKEIFNELALACANREDGRISYDEKYPLMINLNCKITEIVEREKFEQNEDLNYTKKRKRKAANVEAELDELEDRRQQRENINNYPSCDEYKVIRIVFLDNDIATNKVPYTMDLYTKMCVECIEKALLDCENEEQIEDLNDM